MNALTLTNFANFTRKCHIRPFWYIDLDALQIDVIVTFSIGNITANTKTFNYIINNDVKLDILTGQLANDSTLESNIIGEYDYFIAEIGNYTTPLSVNFLQKLITFVQSKQSDFIL